jgi:hypothetical protein
MLAHPYCAATNPQNYLTHFMRTTFHAMVDFNSHLFLGPDTYRILLCSSPFYGMGRIVDAPTHNYFYDKKKHRNIRGVAPVFKYSVDPLMAVGFTTLIGLQFFSHDEHTRAVSNTFLAALPFLWIYKDIIKEIPFKGSLRPKNGCFSPCKKYYGGFPSGHMFEVVFMASLFGAELGRDYAIPLAAFATLVTIQSVAINRHTTSQVVAGAALGCMFAAASRKVIHHALYSNNRYGVSISGSGSPRFTYERLF